MADNRLQGRPDAMDIIRKPAVWKAVRLYGLLSNIFFVVCSVPLLLLGLFFLWRLVESGFHDLFALGTAAVTLLAGGVLFAKAWVGISRLRGASEPPADPLTQLAPPIDPGQRVAMPPQPGVSGRGWLMFGISGLALLGIGASTLYVFVLPDLDRFTTGDQIYGLLIPLAFAVIGALLVVHALRQLARIAHYGRLPLTLSPSPPLLGETFRIEILVTTPLTHRATPVATLTCAKLRVHATRNGHTTHRSPLWNTEARMQVENQGSGTVLSASFSIPPDLPASTPAPDRHSDRLAWLIEMTDPSGELPLPGHYEIVIGRPIGAVSAERSADPPPTPPGQTASAFGQERPVADDGSAAPFPAQGRWPVGTPGKWHQNTVVILGLCLLSLFFDDLGYLLGGAGLLLLWWHHKLQLRSRLTVTALVMAPKLIFWLLPLFRNSGPLVFRFEPETIATSASLWIWCLVGISSGVFLLLLYGPYGSSFQKWLGERGIGVSSSGKESPAQKYVGMAIVYSIAIGLIYASFNNLLRLNQEFHVIDRLDDGRWRLSHEPLGTKAIFTQDEIDFVEGNEVRTRRAKGGTSTRYLVTIALRDGRAFSLSLSNSVKQELLGLTAAMDLPPERLRVEKADGYVPMEEFAGVYVANGNHEASDTEAIELRVENGVLTGAESVRIDNELVRVPMKEVRINGSGELSYSTERITRSSSGGDGASTYTSMSYASEIKGVLKESGLEIGGVRYLRQGSH